MISLSTARRLVSQSDYTPVFLLRLPATLGRFEGMEVPGDAQPEHPAAVLAVVHQREDRIFGMDIPAACAKHVSQQGRYSQSVLQEVLLQADVPVMDGSGGELREILRRGHEVLCLNLSHVERPDGEADVAVVRPPLVPDLGALESPVGGAVEGIRSQIHREPAHG